MDEYDEMTKNERREVLLYYMDREKTVVSLMNDYEDFKEWSKPLIKRTARKIIELLEDISQ